MLEQCFEVGVFGRSVFLVGIEAALKNRKGFRIRWLGNSLDEALWEIEMLSPHAVLFESGDVSQTVIAVLMREYPNIQFIGLEPERDTVTVISSNEQTVSSGEELVQVILHAVGRTGG